MGAGCLVTKRVPDGLEELLLSKWLIFVAFPFPLLLRPFQNMIVSIFEQAIFKAPYLTEITRIQGETKGKRNKSIGLG